MSYAEAKTLDQSLIPVVDIQPLRDGSDPKGVAKLLHEASQKLGFIYIKGHGIPEEVIDSARAGAYEFFGQTESVKAAVKVTA